jgi:hypothetical protein
MSKGPRDVAEPALRQAVEAKLTADGWETDSERVAAGTYRIAGLDPETSTRRFVLAVPSETATVTESQIEWVVGRAQEVDADVVEVTTNGSIAEDARRLVEEHDIAVRDPGEFQKPPDSQTQQSPTGQPTQAQQPPAGHSRSQPPAGQSQPQRTQAQPQQQPAQQPSTQQASGGHGHGQQPPPRQQNAQQPPAQQTNPQQPQQQQAPAQQANSTGIPSVTRLATVGGGVLGGASLMQPWVVSIDGSMSWDALATEMGTVAAAGVALVVVLPILAWGDGWSRLSSLVTGVAGLGMGYLGIAMQGSLAAQATLGYVKVEGNRVPVGAVEAGSGLELFVIAGGLVVLASLAGLLASFT